MENCFQTYQSDTNTRENYHKIFIGSEDFSNSEKCQEYQNDSKKGAGKKCEFPNILSKGNEVQVVGGHAVWMVIRCEVLSFYHEISIVISGSLGKNNQ